MYTVPSTKRLEAAICRPSSCVLNAIKYNTGDFSRNSQHEMECQQITGNWARHSYRHEAVSASNTGMNTMVYERVSNTCGYDGICFAVLFPSDHRLNLQDCSHSISYQNALREYIYIYSVCACAYPVRTVAVAETQTCHLHNARQ